MKTVLLNDIDSLFALIGKFVGHDYLYRGVPNHSFTLKPKAGRRTSGYACADEEINVLQQFKIHACRFIDKTPTDDWQWLALMQHYGVPTRLLDWTTNPLVATYFAVESCPDTNGAIYLIDHRVFPIANKSEDYHAGPLAIKKVCLVNPSHVTDRMASQSGVFTAHPRPSVPLNKNGIIKVIISSKLKPSILRRLYRLGIHKSSLFPGLDGLGEHLQWEYREAVANSMWVKRLVSDVAKKERNKRKRKCADPHKG